MKLSKALIVLAGLTIGAGIGLLYWFTIGGGDSGIRVDKSVVPSVGSIAPDFELESLSRERIHLSQYKGKPVLINFWATWCTPCKLEMPAIEARYDENRNGFTVLAINFDEPKEKVQTFVQDLGLTFMVLLDPGGKIQNLYHVRGYPSTYLVDWDGVIQVEHIGLMTGNQLDGYLAKVGLKK